MLLSDALSRFQSLLNEDDSNRIFSTGTDEHGLKIEQAARKLKTTPLDLCNKMSSSFLDLAKEFDIDFTHFIRTTNEKHKEVVRHVWETLAAKDLIYKSKYEGWYSVSDECFTTETSEEIRDGKCVRISNETGNLVEWSTEENYMFRLSHFIPKIKEWLLSNEKAIIPTKFYNKTLRTLDSLESKDLSVSRPRSRLSWGIPVPGDDDQIIYVWMDALVNYLTVSGFKHSASFQWPPSTQVIGKDILSFHAIYWPAFLLALDLELPQRLVCHSHWTINGLKMSKSKGNIVDPFSLKTVYGCEAIRYFLLREAVLNEDGNFSERELKNDVNSELSNTLGNLMSRCVSQTINVNQEFPVVPAAISSEAQEILEMIHELPKQCFPFFSNCQFNHGVDAIMNCLRRLNLFVQEQKPWKEKDPEKVSQVVHVVLESVRVAAILLQPITPKTCCLILNKINSPENERKWKNAEKTPESLYSASRKLSPASAVVFPRINK